MGHARLRTHPADRGTGASTQVSGGCRTSGSLLQPEAMKKFILLLGVAGARVAFTEEGKQVRKALCPFPTALASDRTKSSRRWAPAAWATCIAPAIRV